jgi:hypothetical protein
MERILAVIRSGLTGNSGLPKGARNKLAEAMIEDLYQDWKEHGIQAIREVRERRPSDYLRIVAMIVSKAEDLSLDSEMRDAAVEQFIEERRQQALLAIAKMRETPMPEGARAAWPNGRND